MDDDLTSRALRRSVIEVWNNEFGRGDYDRMACAAVHEVVTALRYNPAWCRGLGLGGREFDHE